MGEMKKGNDLQADHEKFMRRALELATKCSVLTSPNPKVGCVIVKDGEIIGEGFTQPVGAIMPRQKL